MFQFVAQKLYRRQKIVSPRGRECFQWFSLPWSNYLKIIGCQSKIKNLVRSSSGKTLLSTTDRDSCLSPAYFCMQLFFSPIRGVWDDVAHTQPFQLLHMYLRATKYSAFEILSPSKVFFTGVRNISTSFYTSPSSIITHNMCSNIPNFMSKEHIQLPRRITYLF